MPIALLASQRARIVAQLIAAERALPNAPDLAAVRLDGILSELLHLWSYSASNAPGDDASALQRLDECAPVAAWRLRQALQAPSIAVKIAHCWALLEALTDPKATHQTAIHNSSHHQARKDSTRHVS